MSDPSREGTAAQPPGDRPLSPELAWDVLKELTASERHFNNLETEYRKLASIWLLAGFAGMGFFLTEETQMAVEPEVAIMAIGLATSIGIFLLWIVDLLVYHRLLHACFEQAKKLEKLYPEFPDVRSAMERTQAGGKVVTTRLRWFYISLTAAPVVFAATLFVRWCDTTYNTGIALIATLVVALYLFVATLLILRISPSSKR